MYAGRPVKPLFISQLVNFKADLDFTKFQGEKTNEKVSQAINTARNIGLFFIEKISMTKESIWATSVHFYNCASTKKQKLEV